MGALFRRADERVLLDHLKKVDNEYARTLWELVRRREKVDPSFAIALVKGALGVDIKPHGSLLLGAEPGDLDLFVKSDFSDPDEVYRVKLAQYALWRLTGTPVDVHIGEQPFDPLIGKVLKIVDKFRFLSPEDFYVQTFWRYNGKAVERDLDHIATFLERVSGVEGLREIYRENLVRGLVDVIKNHRWPDDMAGKLEKFANEKHKIIVKMLPKHEETVRFLVGVIREAVERYRRARGGG